MFKQSDKKTEATEVKEAQPVSSKSPSPSSNAPSIIGADVRLKGNLATAGEVQFDGNIEGDLECGALTIGSSAEVNGGVIADTVTVLGTVSGTIRAKKVRLQASSKVIGDVLHEDLAIESGAHIEGHIKRIDNALAKPTNPAPKPEVVAEKVAQ